MIGPISSGLQRLGVTLTDREHSVLCMMVLGLFDSEIGDRLAISAATVRRSIASIMTKIRVKRRIQIVAVVLAPRALSEAEAAAAKIPSRPVRPARRS